MDNFTDQSSGGISPYPWGSSLNGTSPKSLNKPYHAPRVLPRKQVRATVPESGGLGSVRDTERLGMSAVRRVLELFAQHQSWQAKPFWTSLVLACMLSLAGCSTTEVRQTQAPQPTAPVVTPVPAEPAPNPYRDLPEVAKLTRALEQVEAEYGVQFFRNQNGIPLPYSARARDNFTIADRTGNCLYDIRLLPPESRRRRSGDAPDLPLLDVTPGPCGLSYPDIAPEAGQSVADMESLVVSPALTAWLEGSTPLPVCSREGMIQEILPVPYRVAPAGEDPEEWLWRFSEPLTDPLDLSFGDIVAFGHESEPSQMGIYTGHGLVIYY